MINCQWDGQARKPTRNACLNPAAQLVIVMPGVLHRSLFGFAAASWPLCAEHLAAFPPAKRGEIGHNVLIEKLPAVQ